MTTDPLAPIHPGEILREEFLVPLDMTPYALAKLCHVPRTRFERLVHERAPVTPDTALRLGRYFGTSPEFWLAIQSRYDIETMQRSAGGEIEAIEPREKISAEG
jgi:addiction module HigA family antidote